MVGVVDRRLLRRVMRNRRQALGTSQRAASAYALLRHLRTQMWYLRAKRIGLYLGNDGEIDLAPVIIDSLDRSKKISIPRVLPNKGKMVMQDWHPDISLDTNRYGIAEPEIAKACPLWCHSLLLIPLVAFDRYGNRIGMGGGYYDRMLSFQKSTTCRPLLVGVAYDFQQVDRIEAEAWDIPLDAIATDREVITVSPRLSAS